MFIDKNIRNQTSFDRRYAITSLINTACFLRRNSHRAMSEPPPLTFPLSIQSSGSRDEYREAYIADVLKYHIVCDDNKAVGIYFAGDQLIEQTWRDVTPHANTPPNLGGVVAQTPVFAPQLQTPLLPHVGQPIAVMSSQAPSLVPTTRMFSSVKDVKWELFAAAPATSQIHGHSLVVTTELEVQHPDLSWHVVTAPDVWKGAPLQFQLLVDTGANINSWVHIQAQAPSYYPGNLSCDNSIRWPNEEATRDSLWESKNKVPYDFFEDVPYYDFADLSYGVDGKTAGVGIFQVNTHLTIVNEEHRIKLTNFPLGLAYKVHPGILTGGYDGVLALGQSRYNKQDNFHSIQAPTHGRSIGLMHKLMSDGKINRAIYFILVMHDLWAARIRNVYSMMSLGAWDDNPDIQDGENNPRVVIPCTATPGYEGLWVLTLESITFQDKRVEINKLVRIDSGASQSYLPVPACHEIQEYLVQSLGAPHQGFAPTKRLNEWVTFVFKAGSQKHRIHGQISRFFVTPTLYQNRHMCGIGPSSDYYILGLNFFRTFVVGFEDVKEPKIHLIRQQRVAHAELVR